MALLKELERLIKEIKEKEEKIDELWKQRKASKDAGAKAELLEEIKSVMAVLNKLMDQHKDLVVLLAGMATGSQGPYSSCCMLAGSHLFFVLPP